MNVYIGTRGELKNAYIGEYINPKDLLSNIIAYYPMQWNLNDESWHWYNLTTKYWSYTWGSEYNTVTNFGAINSSLVYNTKSSATINVRYNWDGNSYADLFILWDDVSTPANPWWWFNVYNTDTNIVISGSQYTAQYSNTLSWWHMYSWVFDYTNKTLKFYIDWALVATKSSLPSWWLRWWTRCCIGTNKSSASPQTNLVTWKLWIIFAVQNASTDLLAFYNASKSLYWL